MTVNVTKYNFDLIEFLKQELKSKDTAIKTILENHRQTNHYKSQTVKEATKQNEHSDEAKREFVTPIKPVKIRLLNNVPQLHSPNRFDVLRIAKDDNDNESEKQFNQNESDSHPPRSINSKTSPNNSHACRFNCKNRL